MLTLRDLLYNASPSMKVRIIGEEGIVAEGVTVKVVVEIENMEYSDMYLNLKVEYFTISNDYLNIYLKSDF